MDDWTIPRAESVINISLVSPESFPESTKTATFQPKYTHQFFENESIYGYKNLSVDIRFRKDDMSPSCSVKYDEMLLNDGTSTGPEDKAKADPVEDVLKQFLPPDTPSTLSLSSKDFQPPGTLLTKYTHTSQTFELYHSNLTDQPTHTLIHNMQILVPFFIEAGSAIDVDEEYVRSRWDVFFLYARVSNGAPSFIGFCTVHKYWFFSLTHKDEKDFPDEYRARISQFLILPPYQHMGHGQKLYKAIVDFYSQKPQVKEIVVEDPSDDFERLRDLSDFERLKSLRLVNDKVVEQLLGRKTARQWIDTHRAEVKMPMRQFQRMIELLLLESILITGGPKLDEQLERYMLYVKERLYRHNKDVLIQLEVEERSTKLHETYDNVHDDYENLLEKAGSEAVKNRGQKRTIAYKRPFTNISSVEEEEEEEVDMNPAKRVKS